MSSYLEARVHQGEWLLRIDDIDQTRTIRGMGTHIMHTLEKLGFEWDGTVQYQSACQTAYQDALAQLRAKGVIYACRCSRKSWQAGAHQGLDGFVYPDICRHKGLPDTPNSALRVRTPDHPISITDALQGRISQVLHTEVGDFVVRRADGFIAYQLAVVVDDWLAGITHVVRGADLLLSTPRQVYLQQQLDYPAPHYTHTPLVLDADGKKLSKRDAARPVDAQHSIATLRSAWHFLNQVELPEIDKVADFWHWAGLHWDVNRLKKR